MDKPPNEGADSNSVLDTRPLLNFIYTANVPLLERLLGKPIYVPGEVERELRGIESALAQKLESLPTRKHDPKNVHILLALQSSRPNFVGEPFLVLNLHGIERDLAIRFESEQRGLHPGEAEVLAICKHRGWVAILDDRPAHDFAMDRGIATFGTIGLLIQAVQRGILTITDAENLLEEIRQNWYRAPSGTLDDYLSGRRPIW